ncbi:YsnF/AvaK domain-containing protein [uncultured Fibrella sp.]|uniref:YsnF/AvaK domain-containing protein n=1 Tax=uncultured Fibrella sp. TaxID=1284596 RepID=UPI0035C9B979
MAQTVIGIFDKASEAQSAVESLVQSGFNRNDIDLSTRNSDYSRDTDDDDDHDANEGGISGFFSSLFGSDDDDRNRRYATVGNRSSIVTVHAQSDDQAERAADILDASGAVDIDEKAAEYGQYATQSYSDTIPSTTADLAGGVSGYSTTGATDLTTNTDRISDVVREGETVSVPVIEESIQVGKRTVETGGVRVHSRIIERPVDENVRLRTERVVVQRNPVNRAATDADFTTFREGDIELTEHAERAVVAKEARVVEEVTVGRTVDEHDEAIHDTVRRTDVDIEQLTPTDEAYKTTATNTTYQDNDVRNL